MRTRLAALAAVAALPLLGAGSAGALNLTVYFDYVNTSNGVSLEPWLSGGPMDLNAPIAAGTYNVVVQNSNHLDPTPAFSLTGPGVDLTTSLGNGADSSDTFTTTFQPSSTYTFQDSSGNIPTASEGGNGGMSGSFKTSSLTTAVLATPSATTTPAPAKTAPPKTPPPSKNLRVVVSAAGKLELTDTGKPVTTLVAGTYTLAIVDNSETAGLVLTETGGKTLRYVGTRTVHVALATGQWTLTSRPLGSTVHFTVEPTWA
jgi:hypothetical protein